MPKSKRDKKVSLTKTTKKGKDFKVNLIEKIRKNLEEFDSLYVFTAHNMRNAPLKEVREDWNGSRFFFAKNKLMAFALGQDEASETQKNVHKIAKQLKGQCGLLFTNKPKDFVLEWFKNFSKVDFAKAGFVATRTVTLPAGPLPDFSHALEPRLRTLGLPTCLEKGVIVLREDHTVCTEGVQLKPEEASVLKLIGDQMAEFKISLLCMWSKDGSIEKFNVPKHIHQKITQVIEIAKPNKNSKKKKNKSVNSGKAVDRENLISNLQHITDEIIKPLTKLTTSDHISDKDNKIPEEHTKTSKKEVSKLASDFTIEDKNNSKEQIYDLPSETPMEEDLDQDCIIPEDQTKTPTNKKTSEKNSQLLDGENGDVKNPALDILSPKFGKENPRRSLRTPKPIKRTPEQLKQSVKRLTVSARKVQKGTPRTPKKSKE